VNPPRRGRCLENRWTGQTGWGARPPLCSSCRPRCGHPRDSPLSSFGAAPSPRYALRPPIFPPIAQKQSSRPITGRPWRDTKWVDHFGGFMRAAPPASRAPGSTRPSLRCGPAGAALTISALRAPSWKPGAAVLTRAATPCRRGAGPQSSAIILCKHRQRCSGLTRFARACAPHLRCALLRFAPS